MQVVRKAGGAMIQSSTSLFFGFLILMFSAFEGQFLIGLLLSFSVAVALVFDLFFVPAGMCLWGPKSVITSEP
jgi:predicted RND superfamily exporter protein